MTLAAYFSDLAAAHSIAVRRTKRVMMFFADCAPNCGEWTVGD